MSTSTPVAEGGAAPAAAKPATPRRSVRSLLSMRNIGAVYVWLLIIVLFSIIAPETFPTTQTLKAILNQSSITGIVALSLLVPLAAGYYDLSIGYTMGLAGVLAAYLLAETTLSPVTVGVLTMLGCVVLGLVNAFVVVGLKVDSFIGTLGTGAVMAAITLGISKDQTITGRIGESFNKIASTAVSGIQMPVLYLVVVAVALGWWLERTQMGRQLYAMGFEREAARLSGIKVNKLGVVAFVASAVIAGFAGMVLAARVSSASPSAGPPYLIPAFSAAFLGATQIRQGRFNPWGTTIAVLLIGTGNVGLLLAGGPLWTSQLFEGVVLIAAVALGGVGFRAVRERWRQRRAHAPSRPPPGPVAT